MIGEHGGVETAKVLINAPPPSDGYTEPWRRHRIDFTVEALVTGNPGSCRLAADDLGTRGMGE